MKNFLMVTFLFVVMVALAACGGGGGSSSGGGGGGGSTTPTYTHAELADEFIASLNLDAGYDVTLVKTYTDQDDYIVVYDHDTDTYDSYLIGDYVPGEDIEDYLTDFSERYEKLIGYEVFNSMKKL